MFGHEVVVELAAKATDTFLVGLVAALDAAQRRPATSAEPIHTVDVVKVSFFAIATSACCIRLVPTVTAAQRLAATSTQSIDLVNIVISP